MSDEKRQIIRPLMNVPYQVALRFATPREIQGRYGTQMMFTVQHEGEEKLMFFDPRTAQRIEALELRAGEPFTIMKQEVSKGRAKAIQWLIERPQAAPQAQAGAYGARQQGGSPAATRTASTPQEAADGWSDETQPQGNTAKPAPLPKNAAQDAPQGGPRLVTLPTPSEAPQARPQAGETVASRTMAACLIAAIDALQVAQHYGEVKGLKLAWNEEDVRATAASIYIQAHKDGWAGRDFARQAGGAQ
ncbi:MAG: hypothetical protein MUF01_18800 [Bryobacterales bacterium]|jgi:hypothetical protein|nr:hypothetical protein [Bryobacterales bacterium]